MKTTAIIRIVVWSVVAMIFFSMLMSGIAFMNGLELNDLVINGFSFGLSGYNYRNSHLYAPADGTVTAQGIEKININWLSGKIIIEKGSGNAITFGEDINRGTDDDYKLHYYQSGDTLFIEYCASKIFWPNFKQASKRLTITVPESLYLKMLDLDAGSSTIDISDISCEDIDIDALSGRISLEDITANTASFESISGTIKAKDIDIKLIDIECISGTIDFSCKSAEEISCESVSGSIRLETGKNIKEIDAETISGSIEITLPEEIPGFTAKHSSVSGSFKCDFPVTSDKGTAVYGDGYARLNLSTVSGSIRVEN